MTFGRGRWQVNAGQHRTYTDAVILGDSFGQGLTNGLSSQAKRYSSQLCDASHLNCSEHNFAIGGARNFALDTYIVTQAYQQDGTHGVLPSSAPYGRTWPANTLYVLQASINNLNLNPVIARLAIVTDSLRRTLHRLQAVGGWEAYPGAGTVFTSFAGSWLAVAATNVNSGAGVMRSQANGDVWTAVLPSSFPGGIASVYGLKATGFGAVETVRVDGSVHGTIDNRNATIQSGQEVWEYQMTLSAGSHTITGTMASHTGVETLNGIDFRVPTNLPAIALLNTLRGPQYPGGEHTTVDADVLASNAAVANLISTEFAGQVRLVDIDSAINKNGSLFGPDSIHTNDAGALVIANAVMAAA